MKTLETLKNTYAQEQGFPDWEGLQADCYGTNELEDHMNEICIRAQKSALEKAGNNAKLKRINNEQFIIVDRASITNKENLIL